MVIGLLTLDLHFPGARSLKDKRQALRSLEQRVRNRHNVSLAEVEHQDLWQRAGLGIVAIATSQAHVEQQLSAVVDEIERVEPGTIARSEVEFLA